jgi:hypothetical protein
MMGNDEYLPDPESAGPAPHLEHPGATRSGPRDVGCNAGEERAEQPAQRVVDGGIADEHSSWHPVPLGGPAAAPHDGDGRGGRSGQEHQRSRSDHHPSSKLPAR